jgi:hypothetical protein
MWIKSVNKGFLSNSTIEVTVTIGESGYDSFTGATINT